MSQIAVQLLPVPPTRLTPKKAKRDPFLSSGRGGSGNIRRPYVTANEERSPDVPSPRDRVSGCALDDKASVSFRIETGNQLKSSGRGGAGNIQPSAAATPGMLEDHPQTADILNLYNTKLELYEERIRQAHAGSKVIRSSGRGGSGNISHTRKRSRSQGSSAAPKIRFFTTKGPERGGTRDSESASQARDKQGMRKADKRASYITCSSSSGSSALDTRSSAYSEGREGSFDGQVAVKLRDSVQSDPLGASTNEEARIAGLTRKRNSFLFRYSISSDKQLRTSTASLVTTPPASPPPTSPPPTSPSRMTASPLGWSGGLKSVSRVRASSATSVELQAQEYISFLDL